MRDALKAASLLESATALHREGQVKNAEAAYRRALALDPANADALNLLGLIYHGRREHETAARLMRASIGIRPCGRYWYNLALVLESQGDTAGALAAFRQAAILDPSDVTSWSSAVFAGDLHPYSTPAIRLADRRTFNDQHCKLLTDAALPHANDRDPERRLRIGYLSADFIDHSAGMVFEPVLQGHDRRAVDVYLYWQQRQKPDAHTERFKGYADHWRAVADLSDEQLAAQIRADQIDILVDLSGYSNGHRLLALARKPAPIVVTAWGHVTGLGMDASDYILADEITVPPEHAWQHTERVLHLPCVMAFDPRPPYPDVAPPPNAVRGYTTFGYLGRASKTSEPVWAAWAAILHAVPNSRLVFKSREYGGTAYRQRIIEFFASLRISSSRLEFLGGSDRAAHLGAYAGIDVALDPFPQTGGVTTLEACLMGVPSVSLLGDHLNGRIGASILATIGRGQFVAADVAEYVALAARLGRTEITHEARRGIRAALLDSIICDPKAYAAEVEGLYRRMWLDWLDGQAAPAERHLTLVGAG